MMSRYHPDKLVRDNLSEETLKLAQEKSTAIRDAYETVCGFRKLRT
jgi:DnaJ-domain-containing protein 1